ncbi:hypothetical protein F5Y17DRAFT_454763 [Xylariaceae sp. FL0594]|nr:hypothetical protein F5Y17DRAFT_454763 [Xylariaceae sp. FL0594]
MQNQAQNNSSNNNNNCNNQQQQQQQQRYPGSAATMLGSRRAAHSEAFRQKLQQMALPLAPLVQLTTGEVHPAFPGTLLNFWLLTDEQLEELAHFYHQRTPCRYTFHYPCPINVSLLLLSLSRRSPSSPSPPSSSSLFPWYYALSIAFLLFLVVLVHFLLIIFGALAFASWIFHVWSSDIPLEEKRRKIGRFIGLRGCESPSSPSPARVYTEEEIMEDARRARLADEDEMWRRKLRWY